LIKSCIVVGKINAVRIQRFESTSSSLVALTTWLGFPPLPNTFNEFA